MNKKGFTMVELMVSISIIAIVMVFLVRMLIDAKYDVSNELYDTADQINRAEIIKTIESDLNDKTITNIADGSSGNNLKLTISTNSGDAVIQIDSNDNFIYTTSNNNTKKWTLKGKVNNNETHYKKTNVAYNILKNDLNDYMITINIPVIIDNSRLRTCNDSQMDNIILTFYGNGEIANVEDGYLNPDTSEPPCD